jgi:protein-L-isoaspartate(D-aspartate) O-methyltransferase
MTDFAAARLNMVESQVRVNAVTDERLIAAMAAVPRERFVPISRQGIAYMDEDILVSDGKAPRFLMEPRVFAKLAQLAGITADELVLDVGCGTGYSTAVLARLAGTVVGLEADENLAAQAGATLSDLGVDNAVVVAGPLAEGYGKQAPYDVIFMNGDGQRGPGGAQEAAPGKWPPGHCRGRRRIGPRPALHPYVRRI